MSESTQGPRERWAIVEVMGHRVVPGRITGDAPYTGGVVIEIPLPDGTFAEEFYAAGALFGVRIVPEAQARRVAEDSFYVTQITRLMLPAAAPAPEPEELDDEDDEIDRPEPRDRIYEELDSEIDDLHGAPTLAQWIWNIEDRVNKLNGLAKGDADGARALLIEVGSLAVAAIEYIDDGGVKDEEDEEDEDEGTEGAP